MQAHHLKRPEQSMAAGIMPVVLLQILRVVAFACISESAKVLNQLVVLREPIQNKVGADTTGATGEEKSCNSLYIYSDFCYRAQ
jgi:hypothetical protein